ncbi:hypothetical protein VTI28DRAFT_7485 [Corynascus sepedonium]
MASPSKDPATPPKDPATPSKDPATPSKDSATPSHDIVLSNTPSIQERIQQLSDRDHLGPELSGNDTDLAYGGGAAEHIQSKNTPPSSPASQHPIEPDVGGGGGEPSHDRSHIPVRPVTTI